MSANRKVSLVENMACRLFQGATLVVRCIRSINKMVCIPFYIAFLKLTSESIRGVYGERNSGLVSVFSYSKTIAISW